MNNLFKILCLKWYKMKKEFIVEYIVKNNFKFKYFYLMEIL